MQVYDINEWIQIYGVIYHTGCSFTGLHSTTLTTLTSLVSNQQFGSIVHQAPPWPANKAQLLRMYCDVASVAAALLMF